MSPNEAARLEALKSYGILDTPAEDEFSELALLAAKICGAPFALINFVDVDRQWFKAKVGVATAETPRNVSFCAHTILQKDLLVVGDTLTDARFASNPFVTADPKIRFYAGAPLLTPGGHAIGTLCVLDAVPRQLSADQEEALRVLSRHVVTELELRKTTAELARALRACEKAERDLRRTQVDLERRVTERTAALTAANAQLSHEIHERKRRAEQVILHHGALLDLARRDLSSWETALDLITETDAQTLGVERVSVWLYTADGSEMACENLFRLSSNTHEKGARLRAADYPRYFQSMEESRVIAAHDARGDTRTSEFAGGYLEPLGIVAMMDNAVRVRGKLVGLVCHEHTGNARRWTVEEQEFGASIADMVALALEAADRLQKEEKLAPR